MHIAYVQIGFKLQNNRDTDPHSISFIEIKTLLWNDKWISSVKQMIYEDDFVWRWFLLNMAIDFASWIFSVTYLYFNPITEPLNLPFKYDKTPIFPFSNGKECLLHYDIFFFVVNSKTLPGFDVEKNILIVLSLNNVFMYLIRF